MKRTVKVPFSEFVRDQIEANDLFNEMVIQAIHEGDYSLQAVELTDLATHVVSYDRQEKIAVVRVLYSWTAKDPNDAEGEMGWSGTFACIAQFRHTGKLEFLDAAEKLEISYDGFD